MDFTHRTKNVEIFSELRGYFENYKLTDIRCVRRLDEGDEIHSTLIAMSHSIIEENNVEELWYCIYSLVIQYSPYGFALFVGEADNILTSCNIKENSMEMMHLPGADSNCNGGLFEIIEWAFEHKDEKYMNPIKNLELNMGQRIFKYILGLFNHKINN